MLDKRRFLLLQVRNADDPMRAQEVRCFAWALACAPAQIAVFDLLSGAPTRQQLAAVDVVLLGGSGDYSVAKGGPWLEPALDAMRMLHVHNKPTFASCWGFQAMARALGGEVITDRDRAELGTYCLHLTPEGNHDPVFAPLGPTFQAQVGHEDIVIHLPPDALHLAGSDLVDNHAFRFANKPIYCTQFHPELDRASLVERARSYPRYVETIRGVPFDTFAASCTETPAANILLRRFLHIVFGD